MKITARARRDAKQIFRLCLHNGVLDEDRVRSAVGHVLESKRRGYMVLLEQFYRLVRIYHAGHTAEVQSAHPLPADIQRSIQVEIENLYGPKIDTSFAHNPALIGGMRIRVASDVFDGSVRAGLDALEKRFRAA
jgi:F-type H+-transporting ATPase subunit delta